jgi:ankyrin repeat domain-containing protein 50
MRRSIQFEHSDILADIKKDIEAAQNDTHRQRLVDWLARFIPDPSVEHNSALKKHEETTGSWLLDGDDLKEWSATPNSYLWIHGNGKLTTLVD